MMEDRVDQPPACLQSVATGIQSRIAQHGIEQQAFIGIGQIVLRKRIIAKIHTHLLHRETGSRHLQTELQRDALVRLDTDNQFVAGTSRALSDEKLVRSRLEVHDDLRTLFR